METIALCLLIALLFPVEATLHYRDFRWKFWWKDLPPVKAWLREREVPAPSSENVK